MYRYAFFKSRPLKNTETEANHSVQHALRNAKPLAEFKFHQKIGE